MYHELDISLRALGSSSYCGGPHDVGRLVTPSASSVCVIAYIRLAILGSSFIDVLVSEFASSIIQLTLLSSPKTPSHENPEDARCQYRLRGGCVAP